MKKTLFTEYNHGRIVTGRLPHGMDIIQSMEGLCEQASIRMAWFSIIGAVSSATIGFYDQEKQEYLSHVKAEPFEIISCTGNVSMKDNKLFIHAHIELGDIQGNSFGGHLFSDTIIFAGEFKLEELSGRLRERAFDKTTGLMLWQENSE